MLASQDARQEAGRRPLPPPYFPASLKDPMPAALLPDLKTLQGLARQWEDALLAERGLSPATEASYAQDIGCLLASLDSS